MCPVPLRNSHKRSYVGYNLVLLHLNIFTQLKIWNRNKENLGRMKEKDTQGPDGLPMEIWFLMRACLINQFVQQGFEYKNNARGIEKEHHDPFL